MSLRAGVYVLQDSSRENLKALFNIRTRFCTRLAKQKIVIYREAPALYALYLPSLVGFVPQ